MNGFGKLRRFTDKRKTFFEFYTSSQPPSL
jgi:hypothetical protein